MLLIDYQEKLIEKIHDHPKVIKNVTFLTSIFKLLGKEIFYTEQNPDGLGKTIEPVEKLLLGYGHKFEKYAFSSLDDSISKVNNKTLVELLKPYDQIVVCGIESHICVFQTCFDLIKSGYSVFIAHDACGSMIREHHNTAIEALRNLGAIVLPSISIVYMALGTSKNERFKEALKIVKEYLS